MKLLIISNMSHYLRDGQLVGWGPTVEEIDALATIFEEITHIGCLHSEQAPASSLPYHADNIRFVPLPPAGGDNLGAKLGILRSSPVYLSTILRELKFADMVHLRCPANIPLLALFLLTFLSKPKFRWFKYAGNWHPSSPEAWSYTIQRWFLQKNLHRGVVTVNGKWPNQAPHIFSFYNPCLSQDELQSAMRTAPSKKLASPYRFLYVGRLESAKGVGRIIEILKQLEVFGIDCSLDLVGDGPERNSFEEKVLVSGLENKVHFLGWKPRGELGDLYHQAHFILFPSSSSEGWPKVLSESMAYGVVPIASNVSSIPQILNECQCGRAVDPEDFEGFCEAIMDYVNHPDLWEREKVLGINFASKFTYTAYLNSVKNMFLKAWSINLDRS